MSIDKMLQQLEEKDTNREQQQYWRKEEKRQNAEWQRQYWQQEYERQMAEVQALEDKALEEFYSQPCTGYTETLSWENPWEEQEIEEELERLYGDENLQRIADAMR